MEFNPNNLFIASNGSVIAVLADDIVVPPILHNAVLRIQRMNIMSDDSVLVEMYCANNPDFNESVMFWAGFEGEKFWFDWAWIVDEEKMKRLKDYHNFNCFCWLDEDNGMKMECCSLKTADIDYALRFLTDYFLFLNPMVKTEDILVDVTLNPEPFFDE